MDVSLTLIIIMAVLFACGVYAMLERSLTRVLIGFLLLGNATNLLLLIVMGVPGQAPFYGVEGDISDPLPQALTLTAIVITFAVSAFLLALIYRSWQLGQADTVEDDEADIALRERTDADEDVMDDEADAEDEDATTDFVGVQTAPITVLHMRDHPAIQDDAPVDVAYGARADADADGAASDSTDGVDPTAVEGPDPVETDADETHQDPADAEVGTDELAEKEERAAEDAEAAELDEAFAHDLTQPLEETEAAASGAGDTPEQSEGPDEDEENRT